MPRAHAFNAPSDASRWLYCAGALNLTDSLVREGSTDYQAEGTGAHQIYSECLIHGWDAYDVIGHTMYVDGFKFEVTDEVADQLQPGIDRLREFEGRMVVEMKVDTTPFVGVDRDGNKQFGRLDAGIIGKRLIVIGDLKFGAGVPVSPVKNAQLMLYGLSFWQEIARHETEATQFLFIIDQPRHSEGGGEWRCDLHDLLEFGEFVKRRARLTKRRDAPRTPGEKQCFWCPAAKISGMCPEYERWQLAKPGVTIENLDEASDLGIPVRPRALEGITPERRMEIIAAWPSFLRWGERLHAEALADAAAGDYERVPGYKAGYGGQARRKYFDEKVAEAWLAKKIPPEKLYTKKLVSPAQVDKILGKGRIPSALIDKGKRKLILVPWEDERPAVILEPEIEDLTQNAKRENDDAED